MNCPDDIAPAIVELISTAMLRIRDAGWSGDAELGAIEADHVHNLPALLLNFSPDLLAFYWNVERESFLRAYKDYIARKGTAADFRAFEKAWQLLGLVVNHQSRDAAAQPSLATGTVSGASKREWAAH